MWRVLEKLTRACQVGPGIARVAVLRCLSADVGRMAGDSGKDVERVTQGQAMTAAQVDNAAGDSSGSATDCADAV